MNVNGWVFNIQRFSLHDGPGIRTTVFLKGCPLRCQWCHNPEGLEQQPQVRLTTNLCTRCGRCAAACELGGHEVTAEGHTLHLEPCVRCGRCADACITGALELVGKKISVEDVLAVVRRDIPFYTQSNGGMTLSGGEPLAQYGFSKTLLQAAKAEGMHTALETTAQVPWARLEELAPLCNLFLVDLKHTNDVRHRALTGVSNRRILANIRRMVAAGWPLLLRIPWVPTRNVEESFLTGLHDFLTSFSAPPPIEFLPYHRLGQSKWTALGGITTMPDDIPAATAEDVMPWAETLRAAGISVKIG
ncbi:MAG: glycyl-radical enzyme activating protein [Armatimonadota bacterium]